MEVLVSTLTPRILCRSVDGKVHRTTATYPSHADTACGKLYLDCTFFWTDGSPDLPLEVQRAKRCRECFGEWVSAAEVIRVYGVEGATGLGKCGGLEWRGPQTQVQVPQPDRPPMMAVCPGSEARCLPAIPSAPVKPQWTIHLPLPEPLETLIAELSQHHLGDGDELGVLGRQAGALVEASRHARRRMEESLKSIPITFTFAEPSPTEAELAEMRRRVEAASPGPWEWWTSNSIRRLSGPDGKDGGVLHAVVHRDGVPDVEVREEDMAFIAAARRDFVRLLDEVERLRGEVRAAEKKAHPLLVSNEAGTLTLMPEGEALTPGQRAVLVAANQWFKAWFSPEVRDGRERERLAAHDAMESAVRALREAPASIVVRNGEAERVDAPVIVHPVTCEVGHLWARPEGSINLSCPDCFRLRGGIGARADLARWCRMNRWTDVGGKTWEPDFSASPSGWREVRTDERPVGTFDVVEVMGGPEARKVAEAQAAAYLESMPAPARVAREAGRAAGGSTGPTARGWTCGRCGRERPHESLQLTERGPECLDAEDCGLARLEAKR